MLNRICTLGLILLFPVAALADFQCQRTTQVTGGSILKMMKMVGHFSRQAGQIGEPVVSTVYVKGNKMARVDADGMEIIDLDQGTITHVNLKKSTYTVMTFEQMRQQMEAAMAKAKEEQGKTTQNAGEQVPNDVDMKFNVNVRNTGATRQVSGLNANESILTMQMVGTDKTSGQKGGFDMTNDMWLVPDVPGYGELRDFQEKLALKMGSVLAGGGMSSMLTAMQPAMSQGMSQMAKEMTKIKGVPVEQIMRMGATANGQPLPAASEAPLPAESSGPSMQSAASDVAKNTVASAATSELGAMGGIGAGHMPAAVNSATESAASSIASKLGGLHFGGFGHHNKKEKTTTPPPVKAQAAPPAQPAPDANATVLMETRTSMTSFSSAPIDDAKFSVPAGFTQVQPPTVQ